MSNRKAFAIGYMKGIAYAAAMCFPVFVVALIVHAEGQTEMWEYLSGYCVLMFVLATVFRGNLESEK